LLRAFTKEKYMSVAYVAQTRDHLLMLDHEGVCLHVHRRHKLRGAEVDEAVDGAIRCIGAQYVAAIDIRQPGALVHEPVVGAPMLFAKANENGRISIVRTGPIVRFEARASGLYDRASVAGAPTAQEEAVMLDDDDLDDDEVTSRFRAAHVAGARRGQVGGRRS
jgi:hypothetical protein